ncbi:bifunctional hydroxymethylpyrimidine kinase/phosphomethylpyrimidine kinase [Bordetella genomosp. 13]|uniref:bifunctional hydroxymethylpyrimidine kinase/phosphomethylpyrimidine kinase n=1 Tax=Bordetella genomosp. 13 TaxID=463040 RepID=UPI0021B5B399
MSPVDPSGTDGLPADAVTCARLNCHGLAAATALTVQDTAGIEEIHPVSADLLDDQARCLLEDMPVQAIKVGGLYSTESASVAAQIAADYSQVPLVLHLGPRGPLPEDAAAQDDADDLLSATLELLLPQANLVVVEHMRLAHWQSDGSIDTSGAPSAAHALLAGGAQWALVLGAPLRPGHHANTLIGPEGETASWPWQAPPDRNADTGGVAATAAAAFLAQGLPMARAVELALIHADQTLAGSFLPGMGRRIPNRLAGNPAAGAPSAVGTAAGAPVDGTPVGRKQ